MKHINSNLISLKCVIFLFFGGLGCLFPFLTLHMHRKGLSWDESIIVSIVAPCIALVGPLVAGPLADKLAGGTGSSQRSKTGRYLRVMLASCFILAAIFYWLLMIVPQIHRSPPEVSFSCDEHGGSVLQRTCGGDEEKPCHDWNPNKRGSLFVNKCRFTCAGVDEKVDTTTSLPYDDTSVEPEDYDGEDYNERDFTDNSNEIKISRADELIPHPHICYTTDAGQVLCEVFTKYTSVIDLNINLNPSVAVDLDEDNGSFCHYNIGSNFHCRIPELVKSNLTKSVNGCEPIVRCEIHDPYNSSSILAVSECGYNSVSFWLYLFIRSFADIFPAAAVALLDAAVVIATRETSTGRGDVGKQLAFGALGLAIFAPIVGAVESVLLPLILFSILMALAALIILLDGKMPLSPPEWWWHTRCGLLALPMSSVRRYGLETAGLTFVLLTLGVFWGAMDSYLPWHISKLQGTQLLIGLTITAGALPAVPMLAYAEKIVDYCGHTNIFITAFTFYIIHYTGLAFIEDPGWLLICEALEILTLHLVWITAVLYLRHLVPRQYTVCGQALPVVAHFCLGRFLGALIGSLAYTGETPRYIRVHQWFATSAAIIATIYFLLYHFYLAPKCAAPLAPPPRPAPAIVNGGSSNGSYTPLRVYHNGKAKKGHFRY